MATETLSAKEVAQELGTDARTLRKFLRDHLPKDDLPGQGGRYAFTQADVTKLKKAFEDWGKPKAKDADGEAKPAKARKKGKKAEPEEAEEIEDEVEDFDLELEDIEPEDEEIDDVDLDDLDED